MDLSTTYLGLSLANPLVPGASPFSDNLDTVRKLEAHGAAAIVMHSLYEEQITLESTGRLWYEEMYANTSAEAAGHYPRPDQFAHSPAQYLEHIKLLKQSLRIPVIASLNCTTRGKWTHFADLIQSSGADALELNIYMLPTNPDESSADVESRVIDIVRLVRQKVTIPLAVKLSPFYTALPNLLRQLTSAGANGVVLFNRFYQPDFDLRTRSATPTLSLSDPADPTELRLRLRWLSILSPQTNLSLALTGGLHTGTDVAKAILAGAHITQTVSALLRNGPERLETLLTELTAALTDIAAPSLAAIRGSLNHGHSSDPAALERGGYLSVLHQWPPPKP